MHFSNPAAPPQAGQPARPALLGRVSVMHGYAKSILTPTSGFMGQYKFTLNPYGGCAFGCEYCYARFFAPTSEQRETWGQWALVTTNARELIARACRSGELRLGREPDYDKPGLPLVYALKYMPRRVISTLGSLLSVDIDRYPTSVLDVGSGATALALDLINAPRHMNLLGIEPSREMIAFADSSRFTWRVTTRYQEGSLVDGTLGSLPLEPFDLLVLSASFPYHFEDWGPLLDALGSYKENVGKMILVVGPEAKADILDSFAMIAT